MKLNISLLIILLLFSCTIEKNKQVNEEKVKKPKVSGLQLYQSRCTSCHGFDGKMGFGGAKDLTQTSLSVSEIIFQVTNGKGAMAPYKNLLSDEEIDSVSHYVYDVIRESK